MSELERKGEERREEESLRKGGKCFYLRVFEKLRKRKVIIKERERGRERDDGFKTAMKVKSFFPLLKYRGCDL